MDRTASQSIVSRKTGSPLLERLGNEEGNGDEDSTASEAESLGDISVFVGEDGGRGEVTEVRRR